MQGDMRDSHNAHLQSDLANPPLARGAAYALVAERATKPGAPVRRRHGEVGEEGGDREGLDRRLHVTVLSGPRTCEFAADDAIGEGSNPTLLVSL